MVYPVPRQPRADSVVRWTVLFFRVYQRPVAMLATLSVAEIALRAVAPWPLKLVVDRLTARQSQTRALLAVVLGGLAVQLAHQLVLLIHTRMQAMLAQQMVLDLRSRLFAHLQYLSLAHHSRQSTAD